MRLHLGFPSPAGSRTRIFAVLGLALAAACSDDGLANQSSGQNETSTTGGPVNDASNGTSAAEDGPIPPPSTTAEPDGTTASSLSSTGEPDVTTSGTATIDPESVTETGTGTGTDGTATDGTTGGGNQACADGCAVEFTCGTEWASEADCVAWCEANLVKADAFSPFCRDAWENLSACLATLTCEEFGGWQMPTEFPYPCSDADVVLSVECKGQ